MGAGSAQAEESKDYENVIQIFTSGFWKVHSAIHKGTQARVSLWLLERNTLKSAMHLPGEFDRTTANAIHSIAELRRLNHPHVLKVTDTIENAREIGFSAEEVDGTLATISLSPDDITYVGDQLARTLNSIHTTFRIISCSLTPDGVCLTRGLDVKLCDLSFSVAVAQPIARPAFSVSPVCPPLHFSAPEVLFDGPISPACDVFSWAAVLIFCLNGGPFFDSGTVEDQMAQIQDKPLPAAAVDDLRDVLTNSLLIEPSLRPAFDEILRSKAFLPLAIRSLRFVDLIADREDAERYDFYSKLRPSLPLFSDRILRYKLQPLFIADLMRDVRYGPVLIPLIFNIGRKYDKTSFMREIVIPLQGVLARASPEELVLANLSVTPIIVDCLDVNEQFGVLYPLFMASLQSKSDRLRGEAIKHIPHLIANMTEDGILTSLIPTLLGLVEDVHDIHVVCSVVDCMGQCLARVNSDTLCLRAIPKLMLCWNRIRRSELAASIANILQLLHPTSGLVCRYVLPVAADILSSKKVDLATENLLATIISESVDALMRSRKLTQRAENWMPKIAVDSVKLARPVRVAPLSGATQGQEVAIEAKQSQSALGNALFGRTKSAGEGERFSFGQQAVVARPEREATKRQPSLFSGMTMGVPKKPPA
jgi:SCY1-like protein 2